MDIWKVRGNICQRTAKAQAVTAPNTGTDIKQEELLVITGGRCHSHLEDSLAISYRASYTAAMWPSILVPQNLPTWSWEQLYLIAKI